MIKFYHRNSNNAKKQEKTAINMNKTRMSLLTSVEIMAEEATSKVGRETVSFIISNLGSQVIDDLPDAKLQEAFNQLQLIAEGGVY